jgi:hypothetical protein
VCHFGDPCRHNENLKIMPVTVSIFLCCRRAPLACAAVVLLLVAAPAMADDGGDTVGGAKPVWTFGGYGTLGLAHSNERQADYSANVLTPGSAGYSRSWAADVDSRLGMQLGVELDSRWSAVVQVVSESEREASYRPVVEWANIKYQATPDLSIRLGRIALPLFLAGDYRKASFALPWLRPPVELYSAIPISNSDGIDFSYRWNIDGFNNVTQASFGRADVALGAGARAKARALKGLSNITTSGALTLRASAMETDLSVDIANALFDAFRQFGPQGAALVDRYAIDHKRADVIALGFSYDPGQWFVMGEAARMKAHSFLGDKTAGYLSGGYRFGDLAPYLTLSAVRADMPTSDPGLDTAGLPPQLAGAAAQLNGGLNAVLSSISRQHTATAGLRWDFHANYALTLQYDRVMPETGSTGTLTTVQPGFVPGHAIGVVSVSLDFVF